MIKMSHSLWSIWVQVVSVHFLTGQSNTSVIVFIQNILASSVFCLFVCVIFSCKLWFSSGGEVKDYIKCELIGGESPRYIYIHFF